MLNSVSTMRLYCIGSVHYLLQPETDSALFCSELWLESVPADYYTGLPRAMYVTTGQSLFNTPVMNIHKQKFTATDSHVPCLLCMLCQALRKMTMLTRGIWVFIAQDSKYCSQLARISFRGDQNPFTILFVYVHVWNHLDTMPNYCGAPRNL